MNRRSHKVFIFILLYSLAIVLIDCMIIDSLSSEDGMSCNEPYSELPCHFDGSHFNHGEDIACFTILFTISKPVSKASLIVCNSLFLDHSFTSSVWQPPRVD